MRGSGGMMSPDPMALLAGAANARTRPVESAAALAAALAAAPEDPELRLAAFRFHFFAHDHDAARPQALWLLAHAARRLNIATDWRLVAPGDADFSAMEFVPGLYMQALVALAYGYVRQDRLDEAGEILEQAARLDPADRFGGAWMLAQLAERRASGAE